MNIPKCFLNIGLFSKLLFILLIFVNGLSIEQASTHIRSKMLKVYPALASSQTKLNINISKIKSIGGVIL